MESIYERENRHVHAIHWSSILSGSFVALGIWLFLYSLGAAIGGGGPPNAWTGVYVVVSPVIALFCGGLVVGRSRGAEEGSASAGLHGAVVWGFAVSIGAILFGSIGAALISGTSGANLPSGYMWAVAGTLLASLIACVLGAGLTKPRTSEHRESVMTRREVHP